MGGSKGAAHSMINAMADRPRLTVLPRHAKLGLCSKIDKALCLKKNSRLIIAPLVDLQHHTDLQSVITPSTPESRGGLLSHGSQAMGSIATMGVGM